MHIIKLLFIFFILLCNQVVAASTQVEIKTNFGSILLELYPKKAPNTVKNFLSYVQENHYKDTIFQGGGFDKSLKQKLTRQPIDNEADNGLKNEIGTIAMARTANPHSATAQFFINLGNNKFLNYTAPNPKGYGYTVFGRVISGMDVVSKISVTPTGANKHFSKDAPKEMIVIKSISTTESVSEETKPVK
jgi:peptidyl-prolyl cis-trans isomerase A (cyclophilin A)/peptidyl-prolyl cis-trans isomerase B (cyclophilin B)